MRIAALLLLSACAAGALAPASARDDRPAPRYTVSNPGPGPKGESTFAAALSPSGQIVGCWIVPGGGAPNRAFLWDGKWVDLWRDAPDEDSQANAINGKDQIAGWARVWDARGIRSHAWLWSPNGGGNLGPRPQDGGGALAINEAGEVLCTCEEDIPGGPALQRAYLWKAGRETDLQPLPGKPRMHPVGLNSAGKVVGDCEAEDGTMRAVIWEAGKPSDLGLLPMSVNARATAINDSGAVVGVCFGKVMSSRGVVIVGTQRHENSSSTQEGPILPFIWEKGKMTNLARLEGAGYPHALNNKGQIVGVGGRERAVLWENGKVFDLNNLVPAGSGWDLRDAVAINDRGQILVNAFRQARWQALLLTPKPPLDASPNHP